MNETQIRLLIDEAWQGLVNARQILSPLYGSGLTGLDPVERTQILNIVRKQADKAVTAINDIIASTGYKV